MWRVRLSFHLYIDPSIMNSLSILMVYYYINYTDGILLHQYYISLTMKYEPV